MVAACFQLNRNESELPLVYFFKLNSFIRSMQNMHIKIFFLMGFFWCFVSPSWADLHQEIERSFNRQLIRNAPAPMGPFEAGQSLQINRTNSPQLNASIAAESKVEVPLLVDDFPSVTEIMSNFESHFKLPEVPLEPSQPERQIIVNDRSDVLPWLNSGDSIKILPKAKYHRGFDLLEERLQKDYRISSIYVVLDSIVSSESTIIQLPSDAFSLQ